MIEMLQKRIAHAFDNYVQNGVFSDLSSQGLDYQTAFDLLGRAHMTLDDLEMNDAALCCALAHEIFGARKGMPLTPVCRDMLREDVISRTPHANRYAAWCDWHGKQLEQGHDIKAYRVIDLIDDMLNHGFGFDGPHILRFALDHELAHLLPIDSTLGSRMNLERLHAMYKEAESNNAA